MQKHTPKTIQTSSKMNLETKLKECETAKQMLELILDNYDLSKPLSLFTKMAFIKGLLMGFKMLGIKD